MGPTATTSVNTTNVVNDMINTISNTMVKDCGIDSKESQSIGISIKNSVNCALDFENITQDMNSTISLDCAQSSVTATDLQTALKSAVNQLAESTKSAGSLSLLDLTTTVNFTNLTNHVEDSSTIDNIMKAINKSTKDQTTNITIDGFRCFPVTTRDIYGNATTTGDSIKFKNISQQLTSNVVSKVLQNSNDLVKLVQAVDNDISQAAKATNKGVFESVGVMMSGFAGGMIAIVILICVVGAVAGYAVYGKNSLNGSKSSGSIISGGKTPAASGAGAVNGAVIGADVVPNSQLLKKTKIACLISIFVCSALFAVSLYSVLGQKENADKIYAKAADEKTKASVDAQELPMILSIVGGSLIVIIAILTIIAYLKPRLVTHVYDNNYSGNVGKPTWKFLILLILSILASIGLCIGALVDEYLLVGAQNETKKDMIN
jgi:hypothetical protein